MQGEKRNSNPAIESPPPPNRSTGQDAVKVIKGELQQLLPGVKIFLDARRCSAPLATHSETL